jgi:hypothetical protein
LRFLIINSFIALKMLPYEAPYHAEAVLSAGNGQIKGRIGFYCAYAEFRALEHFQAKWTPVRVKGMNRAP